MGAKTFAALGLLFASSHFVLLVFPAAATATSMSVKARSAMLIDLTDNRVLHEQNADTPIPPASLTKVLTLYLVHEAIEEGRLSPGDIVRVSPRAAARGGSRMGLREGDEVPVAELIKGMAVASGNDACVAIAEHLCGSVERFVQFMNRKAAELGMHHTVFLTADGLPAEGQITTARDMAKLSMAYLKRFPYALGVHSMQSYTYRCSTHRNANRLLGTCPGVDGLKTGFVCASGYNFIATANRGDHRLVAVVLGAPSPGVRAAETAKLINHGYAALGMETPPVYLAKEAASGQTTRVKMTSTGRLRPSSGGQLSTKFTTTVVAQTVTRKAPKVSASKPSKPSPAASAEQTKSAVRSKAGSPVCTRKPGSETHEKALTKRSASSPKEPALTMSKKASPPGGGTAANAVKAAGPKVLGTGKPVAKAPESSSSLKVQAAKATTPKEASVGTKDGVPSKTAKTKTTPKEKPTPLPAAKKATPSPKSS